MRTVRLLWLTGCRLVGRLRGRVKSRSRMGRVIVRWDERVLSSTTGTQGPIPSSGPLGRLGRSLTSRWGRSRGWTSSPLPLRLSLSSPLRRGLPGARLKSFRLGCGLRGLLRVPGVPILGWRVLVSRVTRKPRSLPWLSLRRCRWDLGSS